MKTFFYPLFYRIQPLYNRLLSAFMDYSVADKIHPSITEDILIRYNRSRDKGPKKLLCYAPFNHMYFGFNGSVRACCINKKDLFGNISQMSVQELWKSEKIEPLRNNIRNHNLSGGCEFCELQLRSSNFKAFEGRIYDTIIAPGASDYPSQMTFELSNTCNLECIMCNGTYSSSIRKNRENLPPLKEAYDAHFIEYIKEALPHLKVVRLIGGEPFLIPQYYDIIEFLIEHNPSCKIYIQTNGSILNQRVKKIIENSTIHLSISVDSLKKETYEYIRKNASFDRLMEHMEYFKERSRNYKQVININFCVMTANWMEVPDMLAFCNEHNFTLSLIPVEIPESLSLRSLDLQTLKNIQTFYTEASPSSTKGNSNFKLNLRKYNDLIHAVDYLIGEKEKAIREIEEQKGKTSGELKDNLRSLFQPDVFRKEDIDRAMDLLDQYTAGMDERARILYISAILRKAQGQHTNIIKHYYGGERWVKNFENYFFKNMPQETVHQFL